MYSTILELESRNSLFLLHHFHSEITPGTFSGLVCVLEFDRFLQMLKKRSLWRGEAVDLVLSIVSVVGGILTGYALES